jgi:DNA/RNA-binding domain of Phe-tRNA-synthetase-like protein
MARRVRVSSPARFAPAQGWCAREVEEDLPELRVLLTEVPVSGRAAVTRDSPNEVRERLRHMSNRFRGARAVGIRREPVPAAYRVFFRQIGLDPDIVRTPIEAAVLERMLRGGFLSGSLLRDVLLIALIDTGVPVWAVDAEAVDGPIGIRASREGELMGEDPDVPALPAGRLVIADASTALGVLFGGLAPRYQVGHATRRLMLFAVQVAGVPGLFVEEALWMCHTALEQA